MIRQPASVIISGPSGSGKSELVKNLLKERKLFYPPPKKMVYCYDWRQPRFDRMKKQSNVIYYKGLPPEGALVKWFKPHHHGIWATNYKLFLFYTLIGRITFFQQVFLLCQKLNQQVLGGARMLHLYAMDANCVPWTFVVQPLLKAQSGQLWDLLWL